MRLNLRISGTAEMLINDLAKKIGLKPREAVLDSLGLFYIVSDETMKGNQFGFKSPNGEFTAVTTASLSALAASRGGNSTTGFKPQTEKV